jgi:mRNA interferase HigB
VIQPELILELWSEAVMHVITRKHLIEAERRYPDAAGEIRAWFRVAQEARWRSFIELRNTIKDADDVDGYVIFNVRHNRYRLVTVIHYSRLREGRMTQGHIYIRAFLTHREYDSRANRTRE